MTARVRSIDMAKGLAMIAVIFGHTAFQKPASVERLIFAFHMPLFFIASGYFFKQEGVTLPYVKKLVRQLIVPYLLICLGTVACGIVQDLRHGQSVLPGVLKTLSATLYGSGTRTDWPWWFPIKLSIIGMPWFLLGMFWAKLLLAAILKAFRHPAMQAIAVLAVSCAGVLLAACTPWLPLSVYAGFASLLFLWLGYLFRRTGFLQKPLPAYLLLIGLIAAGIAAMHVPPLYLVVASFRGGVLNVICGAVLSFLILAACERWDRSGFPGAGALALLGRNTLWILALHKFESVVIPWSTKAPALLSAMGIPATYWTVALLRLGVVLAAFSVVMILRHIIKRRSLPQS